MSTDNICFCGQIRKISTIVNQKSVPYLELCTPQPLYNTIAGIQSENRVS